MATEGQDPPITAIDGYPIDVTTSEDHNWESEVTEYPVEKGGDKADHIRNKSPVVSMEGVVSDSPLAAMVLERLAAGDKIPGALRGTLPSVDALAKLLEVREARQPVTITTSLRAFENMALIQLQIPRTSGEGKGLRFTATFRQLDIVENERTTVKTRVATGGGKQSFGPRAKPLPTFEKAYEGATSRPVFTIQVSLKSRNPVTGAVTTINAQQEVLVKRYGVQNYTTRRLADNLEQMHWHADNSKPNLPKADGFVVTNPSGKRRHAITSRVENGVKFEKPLGDADYGVTNRTSVAYGGGDQYFYQAFTEVVSAGLDPETNDERTIVGPSGGTAPGADNGNGTYFDRQTGTWKGPNGEPMLMMNRQGKPATPSDMAAGNIWGRGPSDPVVENPYGANPFRPGGF